MGSEGSAEQRCEPMDKSRIGGLRCWTSWQLTTKSISIKGPGGKSGGCALKAVELTWGGLGHVVLMESGQLRESRGFQTMAQKSAEGIVSLEKGEGPNGRERQVGGVTHEWQAAEKPA